MAYARILINLDTRGGLLEYITIQWRDSERKPIIDYEGIPYRCRRCHKVGHLYRDFPLLRKARTTDQGEETEQPLDNIPRTQPVQHIGDHDRTQLGEEHRSSPEAADTAMTSTAPPPTSSAVVQPPTEQAGLEESDKSYSLPSLTPPITCMSMGNQSHNFIGSEPLSAMLSSASHLPCILSHSSLMCSLPLPSPVAPPPRITSSQASLSSQLTQSSPRYSLHPRIKDRGPDAVGLDMANAPMTLKYSRGRPSRITKARHTADEEVALGRQQTIFGALRAKDGPIPLPL